jgi:hypothetical protein
MRDITDAAHGFIEAQAIEMLNRCSIRVVNPYLLRIATELYGME